MKKMAALFLCAVLGAGAVAASAPGIPAEAAEETNEAKLQKTQGKLASRASQTSGMVTNSGEMDYIAYYYPPLTFNVAEWTLAICTPQYEEIYSKEGNLTGVLGTDDTVFFSMDDCLYAYSRGEGEQLLASGLSNPELTGIISGRLYFKTYEEDPVISGIILGVYDLETGEQNAIPLEDSQGYVAVTTAGDHIFYIGGHTDISAKPLYELDLETGEIEQLEPHTIGMAYDENGSLYYLSTDAGDTLSGTQTLKRRDIATGGVTQICQGTSEEFGEILMANEYGVFFRQMTESGSILSVRDTQTGEQSVIQSGTGVSYVPDAQGNTFYYSECPTDSNGEVISSTVYQYAQDSDGQGYSSLISNASIHTGTVVGAGGGSVMIHTREHTDWGDKEGYYVEKAVVASYGEAE